MEMERFRLRSLWSMSSTMMTVQSLTHHTAAAAQGTDVKGALLATACTHLRPGAVV
jgi:hypothetical protein